MTHHSGDRRFFAFLPNKPAVIATRSKPGPTSSLCGAAPSSRRGKRATVSPSILSRTRAC
jgi:hypothetical protein